MQSDQLPLCLPHHEGPYPQTISPLFLQPRFARHFVIWIKLTNTSRYSNNFVNILSHLESMNSPCPGMFYLTVRHEFAKVHSHFQASFIIDGQKSFCFESYISYILGPRQRKLCIHSSIHLMKIFCLVIHQINFQVLGAEIVVVEHRNSEALGSIPRKVEQQQ